MSVRREVDILQIVKSVAVEKKLKKFGKCCHGYWKNAQNKKKDKTKVAQESEAQGATLVAFDRNKV